MSLTFSTVLVSGTSGVISAVTAVYDPTTNTITWTVTVTPVNNNFKNYFDFLVAVDGDLLTLSSDVTYTHGSTTYTLTDSDGDGWYYNSVDDVRSDNMTFSFTTTFNGDSVEDLIDAVSEVSFATRSHFYATSTYSNYSNVASATVTLTATAESLIASASVVESESWSTSESVSTSYEVSESLSESYSTSLIESASESLSEETSSSLSESLSTSESVSSSLSESISSSESVSTSRSE